MTFDKLFKSSPAIMALVSYPERKFLDINKTFEEKIGYKRDEVIGKTAIELQLYLDVEIAVLISRLMIYEGKVENIEIKLRKKDGEILTGLFFGETYDSENKIFLSSIIDISDQKILLNQYRNSIHYIELLENMIQYSIVTINSYFEITSWNYKTEELTGYSRNEIVGKKCSFGNIKNFDSENLICINNKKALIKNKNGNFKIVTISSEYLEKNNIKTDRYLIKMEECVENIDLIKPLNGIIENINDYNHLVDYKIDYNEGKIFFTPLRENFQLQLSR